MMNYNDFKKYVVEDAMKRYPDAHIAINDVIKNNNLKLSGLTIMQGEENISPNIYMEKYFDQYKSNVPINMIMQDIYEKYENAMHDTPDIKTINGIYNYNDVKDKIITQVVNAEMNKDFLEIVPHTLINDGELAAIYKILFSKEEQGIQSAVVRNEIFKSWKVSLEDLHNKAILNTEKEFPLVVNNMSAMLEEMGVPLEEMDIPLGGPDLYVLTNDVSINGATVMLYHNTFSDLHNMLGEDFYIMPSSVHELLAIKESDVTDIVDLQEIVETANDTVVGVNDLLSYKVFKYEGKEMTIANANNQTQRNDLDSIINDIVQDMQSQPQQDIPEIEM